MAERKPAFAYSDKYAWNLDLLQSRRTVISGHSTYCA